MHTKYTTISLLALLASTLAIRLNEDAGRVEAAAITKTIVVTVTQTIEETVGAPLPTSSTYDRPPDPASSGSISTTCSHTMSHKVPGQNTPDRKSTRLNSSHLVISYAVFCLSTSFYILEPVTKSAFSTSSSSNQHYFLSLLLPNSLVK